MHTNTPVGELPALFEELREAAVTMASPRTDEEAAARKLIVNLIDVVEVFVATQIRIADALEILAGTQSS